MPRVTVTRSTATIRWSAVTPTPTFVGSSHRLHLCRLYVRGRGCIAPLGAHGGPGGEARGVNGSYYYGLWQVPCTPHPLIMYLVRALPLCISVVGRCNIPYPRLVISLHPSSCYPVSPIPPVPCPVSHLPLTPTADDGQVLVVLR